MLNEQQIQQLPAGITYRLEQLNKEVLQALGQRIKDIGELLPSDVHKLRQLQDTGADTAKIQAELAGITRKNVDDIYTIFEKAARENVEFSKSLYLIKDIKYVPYEDNTALQRYVRAMAKQTADTYVNMSSSAGFMLKNARGEIVESQMSRIYQEVIDQAVTAVSSGTSTYQDKMRQTIIDLADSGLRVLSNPNGSGGKVVEFASGYHRRLDSAARQNILWGVKTCNQSVTALVGEEFGADGYEVDYHSNPRPTHAEMGGRQYAIGEGRTVNGKYYPPYSKAQDLLDDYGCLHFSFPIILGISSPSYSEEKLLQLKAQDEKTFEFEGKRYNGYEATQVQRKLEAAMRNAKDRQIIANAAGDNTLAMQEQQRINQLTRKYKEFSDKSGLSTKMERAKVGGYQSIKLRNNSPKSVLGVANSENRDIINTGAFSGAKKTAGWRERHADVMYDEIRKRTTDVKHISENTPFTEKAVSEIKEHLFFEEHKFVDGSVHRFESDFEQAQAWDRLSQGKGDETDILLLKHEYVELTQMRLHGYVYEEAHAVANKHHDWYKAASNRSPKGD